MWNQKLCRRRREQESRQEGQEIGLRGEFNQATAKKPVGERQYEGLTYKDTCQEVDEE
jgi:hypothetical protein